MNVVVKSERSNSWWSAGFLALYRRPHGALHVARSRNGFAVAHIVSTSLSPHAFAQDPRPESGRHAHPRHVGRLDPPYISAGRLLHI